MVAMARVFDVVDWGQGTIFSSFSSMLAGGRWPALFGKGTGPGLGRVPRPGRGGGGLNQVVETPA